MSREILEAAILKLKASALESYGIIKDEYSKPAAAGTSDRIANEAMRLAQTEGAAITLQQYSADILRPPPQETPPKTEEESPTVVPESALEERSATYRKSQEERKNPVKKVRKKKRES